FRFGGPELQLGGLQLLLDALQLLELLRRRLALQLRARAQLVDARDDRPPALVGGEPRVERLGRAFTREPAAEVVGAGSCRACVDHRLESRKVSRRTATPSCSTSGTTRSARARISSCAFATATPKPAQSSSSRSFSPSPHATVCSGSKPSRLARNVSPEPLFTSGCANSRKCGRDFETNSLPAKRGFSTSSSSVSASGSPTATSFVGSACSHTRR